MTSAGLILCAKALLGAFVVVAMSLLAKMNLYFLIGLVPLFPTFALIGHGVSWNEGGQQAVQDASLFGLLSLLAYAGYLLVMYFGIKHFSVYMTFFMAVTTWATVAGVLIYFWKFG